MTAMLWTITLMVCVTKAFAFSNGAPSRPGICDSMIPSHSVESEITVPPYTITSEQRGYKILVTIMANGDQGFKGFFLQARNPTNKAEILHGTFTTNNHTHHVPCDGADKSAITHNGKDVKQSVTSFWTPPANFQGNVTFRATVVQSFTVFWTNLETTHQMKMVFDGNYEYCSKTKMCEGLPKKCIEKRDCEVLFAYTPKPDGVIFDLAVRNPTDSGVVAGLSKDKKIGDDIVTECFTREYEGEAVLQQSWYNSKGEFDRSEKFSNGVTNGSARNGNLYLRCSWKRQFKSVIEGTDFDLAKNEYYILLAIARVGEEGINDNYNEGDGEYQFSERAMKFQTPSSAESSAFLKKVMFFLTAGCVYLQFKSI